jgi:hypothetical protein
MCDEMTPDHLPTGKLIENCRCFVSVKYRIDDFLDTLRSRRSGSVEQHAVDWLDEVARNPEVDDKLWLRARNLEPRQPEHARYTRPAPVSGDILEAIRVLSEGYDDRNDLVPWTFVECVLPFTRLRYPKRGDLELCHVDSSLVIGGTTSSRRVRPVDKNVLDRINAEAESSPPGDTAYAKVGALPLYIAVEGKNRVRAFRSAGRYISAFTYSCYFPDARTLRLHEVAGSPTPVLSEATSDYCRALILPPVTVPLLESYGVLWGQRLSRGRMRNRRALKRARRDVQAKMISDYMLR